mgnify:FL=1
MRQPTTRLPRAVNHHRVVVDPTRRDFLRTSGALGVSAAALAAGAGQWACGPAGEPSVADPAERELALLALDEATGAGARYADVRVSRHWFESVRTREEQITGVNFTESYGIGVRARVGGSWGFAGTRDLTPDAVAAAARSATAVAAANDRLAPQTTELAPVEAYPNAAWETPHEIDPFDVPLEEKAAALFDGSRAALAVDGVQFVSGSLSAVKERRLVATSEGSLVQQTFIRQNPGMTITAVSSDRSDFQSRVSDVAAAARGWEYIAGLDLPSQATRWAEEAVMKLSAPSVDPGTWDLVLHPSNLWLTIHESIAHPTELDRALGYEANYAGTSFLAPPADVLNSTRLGPDFMTFMGNRTEVGGCATCGWDDEAVPAFEWPIIDDGIFVNYQTTREQAAWISEQTGMTRSQGCAYGQNWASIPFQRMPNVSLMPGEAPLTEEEVIAQTDHGIFIEGDGSYSIDQQRYNAQFAGQAFWEIRNGRKHQMLRDVAYVMRTPDFWNSLAVLGGPETYWLGATLGDAKGQPGQANAVSHGCPTALFRDATIINTA